MRPKKNICRLLYPSNLDFAIFPNKRMRDHGLYWLNQIIFWGMTSKTNRPFAKALSIREVLGSNYAKAKGILIQAGAIKEFKGDYRGLCNTYELAPDYRAAPKKYFNYQTGDKFGEKLNARIKKLRKEKIKRLRKETRAICVKPAELNERESVYKWVYETSLAKTTLALDYAIEAQQQSEQASIDYWTDCGEVLDMGGIQHVISLKSGRLFYIVSCLPRDGRKHILLDGKETEEADIKCAQPYFCSSLYSAYDPAHQKEKEEFLKFIKTEDFYEGLNALAGFPLNDRDDMKKATYSQILFGSEYSLRGKFGQAMKGKFPILFEEIKRIKRAHPNTDKEKKGNEYFAIKLQKLEADITFTVVAELKRRGILCLTVHDSIRVQSEHIELVKELYKAECLKQVGAEATIR